MKTRSMLTVHTSWIRILLLALAIIVAVPALSHAKYASLVMAADTGQVIYERQADEKRFPASLTKMMTLYLMFEAIERGELKPDDKITFSARAARQPPSKLGIRRGKSISVETAIHALITKSANDVASAVSEHMAGTERKFAKRMTQKAHDLGMKDTTFRNASGLPHWRQRTTARDIAILARSLIMHYPTYYKYFSLKKFKYKKRTYKNHNNLLASYEGTDGIKTGYIRASGFNLVASVRRGGRRLIGVVFGGRSVKRRDRHMVTLLNKAFKKLGTIHVASSDLPRIVDMSREKSVEKAFQEAAKNASVSKRWGIQVGAFSRYDRAEKVAKRASKDIPEILTNAEIAVEPLKSRKRTLYRARILGLSRAEAQAACKALKSRKKPCMALKQI